MSLPVILEEAAQAEFDEAYDYYQERRLGLGDDFAAQVQLVLDRIAVMPRMHRVVLKDVRRVVVLRFPYCVYYREEAECVRILSVFHDRRDPAIWQARA